MCTIQCLCATINTIRFLSFYKFSRKANLCCQSSTWAFIKVLSLSMETDRLQFLHLWTSTVYSFLHSHSSSRRAAVKGPHSNMDPEVGAPDTLLLRLSPSYMSFLPCTHLSCDFSKLLAHVLVLGHNNLFIHTSLSLPLSELCSTRAFSEAYTHNTLGLEMQQTFSGSFAYKRGSCESKVFCSLTI